MSTSTTSAHQSASLEQNSRRDLSPSPKHRNSVPRSISDHTPPTRISSPPPSLNKSWHQSYSSFQTSTRSRCPCMHYHSWCEECQTLTTWGQPLHTKQTCKQLILTFGDLKTVIWVRSRYQSPSKSPSTSQIAIQTITKRTAKLAAREALRRLVHRQRADCGAAQRAT